MNKERVEQAVCAQSVDYQLIAELIRAVGTDRFYAQILSQVGSSLGCDRWLLIRYRQFAQPEILVNTSITDELVQRYLGGGYRLDPILRLVEESYLPPVITFEDVRAESDDEYNELFRMCHIRDELVISLPEFAGAYMAFCFDRKDSYFDAREVRQAQALHPVLTALHRLHIERGLMRNLEATGDGRRRIVLATSTGQILHRSHVWSAAEQARIDQLIAAVSQDPDITSPIFLDDHVLHWEGLPPDHLLAPGGRIFLFERKSPGYIPGGLKSSLDDFVQMMKLSPRERDLVDLTIRGYPTAAIAEKLDLTVGTVKIYKHRLYEKLDITSEREIFLRFINFLFEHPSLR